MRPEDFSYMKFSQWELDLGYKLKMERANKALEEHKADVAKWITETLKRPTDVSEIGIVTDEFDG